MQVFINFITAAANDVCKEKKRATINADDVFQALEDLEFAELLPALKESFEGTLQLCMGTDLGQALTGGEADTLCVQLRYPSSPSTA